MKVLNKYPGVILSVEAERTKKPGPKPELFYEFDVELDRSKRIIEIECNPNTLELMDYEEEVEITDERFSENALISLEKAKLLLKENKGKLLNSNISKIGDQYTNSMCSKKNKESKLNMKLMELRVFC